MLSEPLDLASFEASEIIEKLYSIFQDDFILTKTHLATKIYIDPQSYRKDDDKELAFWHLTTKEEKQKEWVNGKLIYTSLGRFPDFSRASRLEWVKQIITQHDHASIKLFYHRETNKKRNIRLYLWAYNDDFVVILQKLGKSSAFLITSFYITDERKRKDYQSRFENYCNGDQSLNGCEWF